MSYGNKQYLDNNGLSLYDSLIKQYIASQEVVYTGYGTCNSAADAQIKVATVSNSQWKLIAGTTVNISFTNTNTYTATTAAPCQLNVNGTGAKNIYYGGDEQPIGSNIIAFGKAGYVNQYLYNGTYWVWIGTNIIDDAIELTYAEYLALPESEKNNGRSYYVTDTTTAPPSISEMMFSLTGTLTAGSTSVTISDIRLTADSKVIPFYSSSQSNVSPSSITPGTNSITFTYAEPLSSDLTICVLVFNV